jgi:hypothetical protein
MGNARVPEEVDPAGSQSGRAASTQHAGARKAPSLDVHPSDRQFVLVSEGRELRFDGFEKRFEVPLLSGGD